jgi:hypothetical protein
VILGSTSSDFNFILVIAQEIYEREVLFELFEQQFNLPIVLIYPRNSGGFLNFAFYKKDKQFRVFIIPICNLN